LKKRAEIFRYVGLDITNDSLIGHYQLDNHSFTEFVTFDDVDTLQSPAVMAVAELWYLIAGLSYYKAGAAKRVDVGSIPLGTKGRALLHAALHDGLGEFAFNNDIVLDDVVIGGGANVATYEPVIDANQVLIAFGGGIDSVVTVAELAGKVDRALFVVSPARGRFAPLEETAAVTGLDVVRATRTIDAKIINNDNEFLSGHVPVTTMVTLLTAVGALASGRGAVAMSNEHSSSIPNLRWHNTDINHQWSKSWDAEQLIADAISERIGNEFVVASYLRDRSELWVAKIFSQLEDYHHVFRSCNRAFTQVRELRAAVWCGTCDKCLFVNLVLAPFLSRAALRDIFASEPLSDPDRVGQLRVLVGIGLDHKPFECVGDPDESAVALTTVSKLDEWSDVPWLDELARIVSPDRNFDELLEPQGPSRVPANWLR
jgi:hypothetical protein